MRDQTDYENLRRCWLPDDVQPSSARSAVGHATIPVSEIPANYQAAANKGLDLEYVPSLAYAIPKRYPTTAKSPLALR